MSKITTCISSNNNLEYLKLAIKSVRQNAYYKDMPIITHAENCNDGTDEWLEENKDKYQLDIYIDHNDNPKGIGGGMDFCVDKTKTEFVNIIHADMWISPNQDLELLKLYDNIDKNTRLIASSFRIQPKIFPNDPLFAPASWEDMDLFIRMQLEGYEFKMTSKSTVYHFSARGSHFRDEAKDNFNQKSQRQQIAEQNNMQKFTKKWGKLPDHDEQTFVKPIHNTKVKTRI